MAQHSSSNRSSASDEPRFSRHAAHASDVVEQDSFGATADDLSRASFEDGSSSAYQVQSSRIPERMRKLSIVLAVCAVLLGILGIRIAILKHNINVAFDQVGEIRSGLESGDTQAVGEACEIAGKSISAIDRQTHSLPWMLLTKLPVVGGDVEGVQDIVSAVSDFSDTALPTVARLSDELSVGDLFQDGAVNTDALVGIQSFLTQIAPALRTAADDISAVPTARINRLDAVEGRAKSLLTTSADVVEALSDVDLPAMFGANGETRRYVMVAQNNSELRATGGFPGACVLLMLTDGKIELGPTLTIQHFHANYSWTEEESEVFYITRRLTDNTSDLETAAICLSPNFPLAGDRLATSYEGFVDHYNAELEKKKLEDFEAGLTDTLDAQEHEPMHVDGVIAIDPVFLQRMLSLTKGVKVYGRKVNGKNAARLLLHDVYVNVSPKKQDAFFSAVASKGFKKVMSSLDTIDKGALMRVLADSAADYRLQIWMENEAEENLIKALGMAGDLSEDETKPELGVYVNDNTWAKIDWYLDMRTDIGRKRYNDDGTATYAVTTTFTNTATYDELEELKNYVRGYGPSKDRFDDMVLYPLLMAPAGGTISNVQVSKGNDFMEFSLYGRNVWEGHLNLHAEQTITVTYDVTVSANAQADMTLRTTALAQEFD